MCVCVCVCVYVCVCVEGRWLRRELTKLGAGLCSQSPPALPCSCDSRPPSSRGKAPPPGGPGRMAKLPWSRHRGPNPQLRGHHSL